jgi:hypothetical protein
MPDAGDVAEAEQKGKKAAGAVAAEGQRRRRELVTT